MNTRSLKEQFPNRDGDWDSLAAERSTLHPMSPLWGDHRSRYHFAATYVKGKRVLDIACGTGFGEQILIDRGAAMIVAADYSEEALVSTSLLGTPRTFALRTDGTRLPFQDGTFDAVTSFETIEHISNHRGFVSELARVLKGDGVLVMSTPNANYTRPVDGKPKNPYHVYEFTPEEFGSLLQEKFRTVELYGQRVHKNWRICPYWELPEMLPTDFWSKIRIAVWKLHVRLPPTLREGVSHVVSRRSFFPGETDFVFESSELGAGYVQVAVCRP